MEKYYNEQGQVAVLYSPGYGAGWSTWASGEDLPREFLTMDRTLVMLAISNASDAEVEEYIAGYLLSKQLDPDNTPYMGGWSKISVRFVNQGDQFRIDEYDGSESVQVYGPSQYMAA